MDKDKQERDFSPPNGLTHERFDKLFNEETSNNESTTLMDTLIKAKESPEKEDNKEPKEYKLYWYRYVIGIVFCCNLVANTMAQTTLQTIGDLPMDAYDISTIMFQSVTYVC